MRFSIPFVSLLSVSAALPLVPRQSESRASDLLDTIKELNGAVTDLTGAVNNFSGSLLGLLPESLAVVVTEAKVDSLTVKATKIAEDSAVFTTAESTEVVQTLASQITPIKDSLDALKAKQPVFKKTLEAPIVLLDLKILRKHTEGLVDAVYAKVTPTDQGLVSFGKQLLLQEFDSAIAAYS